MHNPTSQKKGIKNANKMCNTIFYIQYCSKVRTTRKQINTSNPKKKKKEVLLCNYSPWILFLQQTVSVLFQLFVSWELSPSFPVKQRTAYDLVLVIPPPPLTKVAHNTRPYSKLRGTTLNEEKWVRGWVSYLTDMQIPALLSIKAVFLCVAIFYQLVKAGSSWILV